MSETTATFGREITTTARPDIEQRLNRLRWWNVVVGLILAVQAVVIAVLTNDFSLPVTATFMDGPPGTAPKLHHLFDIATGWGVFAFLAISAGALLIIASPLASSAGTSATCCRTATTGAGSSTSSAPRS